MLKFLQKYKISPLAWALASAFFIVLVTSAYIPKTDFLLGEAIKLRRTKANVSSLMAQGIYFDGIKERQAVYYGQVGGCFKIKAENESGEYFVIAQCGGQQKKGLEYQLKNSGAPIDVLTYLLIPNSRALSDIQTWAGKYKIDLNKNSFKIFKESEITEDKTHFENLEHVVMYHFGDKENSLSIYKDSLLPAIVKIKNNGDSHQYRYENYRSTTAGKKMPLKITYLKNQQLEWSFTVKSVQKNVGSLSNEFAF